MSSIRIDRYRGNGEPRKGNPPHLHPYMATPQLAKAVNMALVLERPLLIKGPPGCGKTRLADSIAHELGGGTQPLPIHRWHVKSTSRARDGLYNIDMVRRLCDAQLAAKSDGCEDARKLAPYLSFGPLGNAIRSATSSVLLIDEIDKADLDFPNDLLRELDEMRFTIEELNPNEVNDSGGKISKEYSSPSGKRPIVIITSNDEKELPEPFLRRCLFYYIPFPDAESLLQIVRLNTSHLHIERHLIDRATERFLEIRESPPAWRKLPGTTELVDWISILHYWGIEADRLRPVLKIAELPEWEVLFKDQHDLDRARQQGLPEKRK